MSGLSAASSQYPEKSRLFAPRSREDTARLIRLLPDLALSGGFADPLAVVRGLGRALRGERRRGAAGHWSYSLDRHIALVAALSGELTRLRGGRDRSLPVQSPLAKQRP